MIESRIGPVFRDVTTGTIRTILTFVDIIGLMTRVAGFADIGKVWRQMTGVTANRSVSTGQRERRTRVIEEHVIPVALVVAVGAVLAALSVMYIIVQMT